MNILAIILELLILGLARLFGTSLSSKERLDVLSLKGEKRPEDR